MITVSSGDEIFHCYYGRIWGSVDCVASLLLSDGIALCGVVLRSQNFRHVFERQKFSIINFGVVRNLVCAYTSMSPDSSVSDNILCLASACVASSINDGYQTLFEFGIVRFSGIAQREGNSRNNPDMGQARESVANDCQQLFIWTKCTLHTENICFVIYMEKGYCNFTLYCVLSVQKKQNVRHSQQQLFHSQNFSYN
ncbi:hypothetical protein Tsp_03765 [Trichinella spiralis]|uniref:hypothetical protein n=1 Tax=Trichinella spiralis TaxID=6334 RepID=UPI0001EFBD0C|nr:hypothetical protein Tsp_03765 [Trichinella spiralis]